VLELKTLRETFGNGELQTVVIGVCACLLIGNASEYRATKGRVFWIVLIEHATEVCISRGGRGSQQGGIDLSSCEQLNARRPYVSDLQGVASEKFILDLHIVLVRVRGAEIGIIHRQCHGRHTGEVKWVTRLRSLVRKWLRQRVYQRTRERIVDSGEVN